MFVSLDIMLAKNLLHSSSVVVVDVVLQNLKMKNEFGLIRRLWSQPVPGDGNCVVDVALCVVSVRN